MKKASLRKSTILFVLTGLIIFLPFQQSSAQYKEKSYGNTPEKQKPYENYQDAYISHFQEELEFTGAGREKPQCLLFCMNSG